MNIITHKEDKAPTIILKKGKTEIKVENAAAVIKRINEMYPGESEYSWYRNPNKYKRDLNDAEKARNAKWIKSAKDWFRQEVFGGIEDFEIIIKEPEEQQQYTVEKPGQIIGDSTNMPVPKVDIKAHKVEEEDDEPMDIEELVKNLGLDKEDPKEDHQELFQTVNKNAYEIRLEILKEAICWTTRKDDYIYNLHRADISPLTVDDVLSTAKKFYAFVENKNR